MTETKPRINRGNQTVDSCFELLGSRQHGVARHLEEQPRESNVPPNARGSDLGTRHDSDITRLNTT